MAFLWRFSIASGLLDMAVFDASVFYELRIIAKPLEIRTQNPGLRT